MRGIHLAPLLPLGIVDGDAPLAALHEDHEIGNPERADEQAEDHQRIQLAGTHQFEGTADCRWQAGDDTGENQDRDAIADAALGNLLAEPHQEHGAGNQGHGRGENERRTRIDHQRSATAATLARQSDRNADRLEGGQRDRAVTRVLGDLASTGFAFLLQLLEIRNRNRQQLHDDRRRNVRHDAECEDRHALERAAREHVEHAENTGALLLEDFAHHVDVDSGHRDKGTDTEDHQRDNDEKDALAQFAQRAPGEAAGELLC